MTVEERLRRVLDDEVAGIEGDARAWQRIQASVRTRRRSRLARASALAAVAVVAAVVGVAALVARDDGRKVDTVPAAHDTTTAPSTTTSTTSVTTTTTVVAPTEPEIAAIYPFTSRGEAEAYVAAPGARTYFDAQATAADFAHTYLGMPAPVVDTATEAGGVAATVVVRPKPASPVRTEVHLVRVGSGGPWTVTSSSTSHIVVDAPQPDATVASPVHVAGTSVAFEAVVRVEVREAGQTFGQSLGATTVMGGGTEMQPFAGDVAFDAPTKSSGAIVLFTDSAEDGSIVEATVVPVTFDS